MIKRQSDGRYLVKCDICPWNATASDEIEAKENLSRHINIVHKGETIHIEKKGSPAPPSVLPPNLPSPIAPGAGRRRRKYVRTR